MWSNALQFLGTELGILVYLLASLMYGNEPILTNSCKHRQTVKSFDLYGTQ